MASQGAIIIDDTDPRIHYSRGHWRLEGSANEYNRTTHNAVVPGATFSFNFTGTSVKVIGTLPYGTASNSSYTLDGGKPVFYSGILTTSQYQQTFYSSPDLQNTEHTLVGNCTGSTFVWIDFLIVASAPIDNESSSGLVPQQNTTEDGAPDLKPTSYPMGPIMVAFVIGVVLTLLILGTYVLCRRYSHRSIWESKTCRKRRTISLANRSGSAPSGVLVAPASQRNQWPVLKTSTISVLRMEECNELELGSIYFH